MTTAVIGLGNRDRGDDAVGLVVAERLARLRPEAEVMTWERPELDLLEVLPSHDHVVVVDAARSGAAVGTVHVDPHVGVHDAGLGTHGFGIAGVLGLAEELGRLPDELRLVLVEVGEVGHGRELSTPVAQAADEVVARLLPLLDAEASDVSG